MLAKTFVRPRFRDPRMLLALVLGVCLATATSAMGQQQEQKLAQECAVMDIKVVTLIEEHGDAGDLPTDRLASAGMAMMRARSLCYQGRVGEALALYQSILDLGPVASLR